MYAISIITQPLCARLYLRVTTQCFTLAQNLRYFKEIQLWAMFQAFRFMVGPGHCPMISKYGPSLSKAVGPVDPSFLAVKNLTLIKNIYHTASLQTLQNSFQYSKTCLKQPLIKDKTEILIRNGSLMKVKRIAECSPWSILQYF